MNLNKKNKIFLIGLAIAAITMFLSIIFKTGTSPHTFWFSITALPHVNAALNTLAACFLLGGFIFVRRGEKDAHRACMITAAAVSGLFLISYVTLRLYVPIFEFQGQGGIRPIYFTILTSHVILAICIVPLVALTLFRALTKKFELHRKVARWAWPAWMYVSVSGVVVYFMLYQLYPAPEFANIR